MHVGRRRGVAGTVDAARQAWEMGGGEADGGEPDVQGPCVRAGPGPSVVWCAVHGHSMYAAPLPPPNSPQASAGTATIWCTKRAHMHRGVQLVRSMCPPPPSPLQLSPQGHEIDAVEEVLEMLAYLTYYGPGISDALWSLWPRLHSMLMEWGIQVCGARAACGCMRVCVCVRACTQVRVCVCARAHKCGRVRMCMCARSQQEMDGRGGGSPHALVRRVRVVCVCAWKGWPDQPGVKRPVSQRCV